MMRSLRIDATRHATPLLVLAVLASTAACRKPGSPPPEAGTPAAADAARGPATNGVPDADSGGAVRADSAPPDDDAVAAPPPPASAGPVLLLTQSRFGEEVLPDGTTRPKPLPAALVILRPGANGWDVEEIEDPDSNVFHKAMVFDPDGQGPGILTIGAMGAHLKLWRRRGTDWEPTSLWHTTFGGRFDRLRDVEIADVTGDGVPEILLATHDQGVVAVLRRAGDAWETIEINRQADVFVHEMEVGDIDGDGRPEFFTTPSEPNRTGAVAQGGGIDAYRWNGESFDRRIVMTSAGAHAKEILAADLDGDGTAALYAVIEARTEASGDCTRDPGMIPLRIVRYEPHGDGFVEAPDATTLPDCMCRFLTWGDVDGDGINEMVAATKNAGLWLLRRPEREAGTAERIDADSGGFEHAALAVDLDGDGTAEIYVAADKQGEVRRYRWNPERRSFDRETIHRVGSNQITWNVTAGTL